MRNVLEFTVICGKIETLMYKSTLNKFCFILIITLFLSPVLWANPSEQFPQIRYLLSSNSFLNTFPMNRAFIVTGEIDYTVRKLEIKILSLKNKQSCPATLQDLDSNTIKTGLWEGRDNQFLIHFPSLLEIRHHCVQLQIWRQSNASTDAMESQILPVILMKVPSKGYYVSMDLGGLFSPEFSDMLPFLGINFYFDQVEKSMSLADVDGFWKRFALTMGVTLNSPSDEAIYPIVQDRLFLAGMGFRITDDLKLGTGALFFKKEHPNPLVKKQKRRVSGYVSFSIDIDLWGILGDWNIFGDMMEEE